MATKCREDKGNGNDIRAIGAYCLKSKRLSISANKVSMCAPGSFSAVMVFASLYPLTIQASLCALVGEVQIILVSTIHTTDCN